MNKQKTNGFTMIELLVVVAIIGVLLTLIIMAVGSANKISRDNKRLADIKEVQRALELYKADNGKYPPVNDASATTTACGTGGRWCTLENYLNGTTLGTKYMAKLPLDPSYPNTTYTYYYDSDTGDGNQSYMMRVSLEYSKNASKMTGDGGASAAYYEVGPQVQYCFKKYTSTAARTSYGSATTVCTTGN
ncbi:MAG: type II secretion system protein [Patescibacteria group bacterium]|jgi:type II secretion system protein G